MTVPVAGQLGHGMTSGIRRQPVRIVKDGEEGGFRGPYTTMSAALAAYDRHLGLTTSRRRS